MKKERLKLVSAMLLLSGFSTGYVQAAPHAAAVEMHSVQQDNACTGVVVDQNGETVIGASVVVKGTTNGTITGLDGDFSIPNVKKGDVIVVSYVGYMNSEIIWEGKPLKIALKEDSKTLDEVVVVGYATVKKANLTGAVSAVDDKVLADRPIVNLGQGLQGTIPNLNITTSGQPGKGSSFNVRGETSINGGSPLVLVDGVQMDPNLINPQDVASVSVLKDAASASIYGARAAYGVILITTKSGRKNMPTQVSFDASVSFNSPTTRPEYMNSMEYAKQMIPEADREYRVMFRLADAEHMTTDEIEERGKEIGEDFGVPEGNVVENREYLVANYTDPSFVKGMIVVIVMVVLAGILTIYSIYYVSMIPKVQEYGKLKAIGSTKRQIRQMVFREGMLVTALALPVGLLISSFLSRWIMKQMITFMAGEDPLMQVAAELVKNGEVSLLHWWIYAITIMAVLFTSAVSLAKPMRIAAKVSPIEAMRYQGLEKRGKKVRKGYQNLTIFRLTKANMARNKKRTGITIVTLGATGILFMVVATILSCAAPKEIARKDIESDYKIELETWGGDKMNPDRDWRQVQQNNPLTKAFIDQVRDVDGVEEVKVKTFMNGEIPKLSMDGEIWGADIIGLDASYAETLEKGEIQGHVTYEELEKGDKILMSANMLYWFPELKVGDSLKMVLNMGDDQVEKTFEIGAIGDYYESLGGSSFYLPQSVLEKMNPNNLNYTLEITVNDQKKNSAYQELQALADNSEYLVTGSYEEQLQKWEKNMRLMSVLCYAFLIILGGIGIMNLVNTMMNSIYTRRRELGMIQAIGMSEKQLIRMLQLEGIIYTLGTLAVSVGIGSLVGYGAFLYAKTKHIFQISEYHFPVVPAVLLICVVAFLQVLLTYGVSANFRKLSLIDRIRYAE